MENIDNIAYLKAKDKVKEIKGFYFNLMFYCIIIPALIFINLKFTPDYHWFWFSAGGWGVSVLFHGLSTFGYSPFLNREWEERKIKDLMDSDNNYKKI